ncbi:hypothetical protein HOK51_02300 [Candidatus Woesearchaeota archaeon]|jgi:hypothetical protein|nr:hypothetical protein [Candidatus Woesearchaeota archaeon]MBT6518648.1 hypothetical protein [Candidatus Woesearchaeota archaeon]MBT7368706.1 hypothetical protein [Candidatus Woesearchaeota archaeon]
MKDQKKRNSKKPEQIEVYKAIWYRHKDDGRISTNSEGYYLTRSAAQQTINRIKKSRGFDFESGRVEPKTVIKIGDKIYDQWFAYQIPKQNEFADPSKLEEITDSSAKLDLGDGLIATVCTEPMKVKKNPTR